jgi:hypothetical protein
MVGLEGDDDTTFSSNTSRCPKYRINFRGVMRIIIKDSNTGCLTFELKSPVRSGESF